MTAAPISSACPPGSAPHWPDSRARPALVAEDLVDVRDPLAAWLRPGPAAAPEAVASRLAAALLPREASDPAPEWLRRDQLLSYRRALASVRRYGGVLVADPVGTGKTFIALAVALVLEPGRTIHLIVPAVLREQWSRAAREIAAAVRIHTHETLSRGRRPSGEPGPVIVDESHRFRTRGTRRYHTLAPWCIGRRGILLSATPIVNRLEDLSHQLRLFVRDDALAIAGLSSLQCLDRGPLPGALAELVVTGEDRGGALPRRTERVVTAGSTRALGALVRGVGGLTLSRDPVIAGLLRVTLLRAAASSPAALSTALRRYDALLHHASDAAAGGRRLTRSAIRRFVGADDRQLVLWPLVAEEAEAGDLALEDLAALPGLAALAESACAGRDPKARALTALLEDRRPTLVFTSSIATVGYLRRRLSRSGIAWVSGQAAGVDGLTADRDAVLDWFRRPGPAHGALHRPTVLLATDVAAEGLDLPLIERVVHYDLPWTAVRLDQRAGRALRLGSRVTEVEVVRCLPPKELALALRQEHILRYKAHLPERLGLDTGPDAPWRVRARLALSWSGRTPADGVARVTGAPAVVAGFIVQWRDGTSTAHVLARRAGKWSDDPARIAIVLEAARGRHRPEAIPAAVVRGALSGLSVRAAAALRSAHGVALGPAAHASATRGLLRRIRRLADGAARGRKSAALGLWERAMAHCRRGHTAGEEDRLERWSRLGDADLFGAVSRLPPEPPPPEAAGLSLLAVLIVE